jgi:hypothetical protein
VDGQGSNASIPLAVMQAAIMILPLAMSGLNASAAAAAVSIPSKIIAVSALDASPQITARPAVLSSFAFFADFFSLRRVPSGAIPNSALPAPPGER